MLIMPKKMKIGNPPNIILSGQVIRYVESFKYLGHVITSDFMDDHDIEREIKNLYVRGNTIIRRFGFLNTDVQCSLFKSYCYPLYTASLWCNYRQSTLNKLKVAYNNIMRQLMGVPRWHSARTMFVNLRIKSFFENLRTISYSLLKRVLTCNNSVVRTILHSDCFLGSDQRARWVRNLYLTNPSLTFFLEF